MSLSNNLIYKNMLKCADESVANSRFFMDTTKEQL